MSGTEDRDRRFGAHGLLSRKRRNARPLLCLLLLPGLAGCSTSTTAENSKPPTMDEKADSIIRDPMHYSPFSSKPDLSSGGSHLEKNP